MPSRRFSIPGTRSARSRAGVIPPESAAYVFGPENGSLDEAMLDGCTHIVAIPGRTCSNLAAAVNVVLYDRIAKRWARVRHAFPPTDGLLRGVRGGYDRRLDVGD